ncbi:PTS system trehalose-specific EIIBC component [Erysipelothrix sp. HDW6A]|uniref:PTS system trehalose-specific EIIBC component n=1 Tax=Erysipelothrix sp. HDW6A TaxID=2714928 RepID=UPI001F0F34C6|nr:PTS system trehalose-specific EIIBC component [Erysipelothrix sp. HDW6A]
MRFVLKHPEQADVEKIESLDSVKGTFTQAGQFQVIIGNDVDLFYNDFADVSGIEGTSKETVKDLAKSNQNALQRLMSNLAEIFSPLIPALITGGLILGFRNILEGVQIQMLGQKIVDGALAFTQNGAPIYNTIVDVSQFWSGVNHFLWLIGEAIFHFLPVGITWSITRKMGTTQILGIVLGITLVSPQLMNAYGVAGAESINTWNFGFAEVQMIGYQAQVLPAMMAGFVLVYLERFFKKVIPNAVSMVFVPLLSIIPAVLVAHVILGPIGWTIGAWISDVVYAGLTSQLRVLFAAIFGFFYSPLVITGLHHMTNAIDLQLTADFGGTLLWPMIAFSNIAQGSAVLGIYLLHRGDKKEEQVSIPAIISAYLGVTEPAMFGINMKYRYPFIAAMIGSSIAAVVSVGLGLMANSIGVGGLPGFLSFNADRWLLFGLIALIAMVVPATLTYMYGKRVEGNE